MQSNSASWPFFSIVIPVYNREKEILRAVNSCLTQSFSDIEVVVVDDASSDGTVDAIKNLNNSKVILNCHDHNTGVCPARNTGIKSSKGQWVLFLDSDDELLPGALMKIRRKIEACPEGVERLGFLFQRDDGRISPEPVPAECILEYEDYVGWFERLCPAASDFFHCTRRCAFEKILFPQSRAYEGSYLLDFAKEYRTWIIPEAVGAVHMDSANRDSNVSMSNLVAGYLRDATDQVLDTEHILACHGEALQRLAPKRWRIYCKAVVLYSFLAGQRTAGSRYAIDYLKKYPGSLEGWVIWLVGMVGPRALAWVKAWKHKG